MLVRRFRHAYAVLARVLVRSIIVVVGRLDVEGRENLPPQGPFICVTNHLSKVDAPLVLVALPVHLSVRVFAASKWRPHPVFGPILGLSGAIWVRRGEVDRKALHEVFAALKEGQVLGMAPEGTRSRSQTLQKARQGAAYIASRARVPVVPMAIINSDRFQANILKLRRTHFRVRIGEPLRLPELAKPARGEQLEAYSELIMAHIAALLPQRYWGHYATSPALAALQSGEDPWPAALAAVGRQVGGSEADET
jgi:1-acyl-sn-glycerol-3-phosphate acyltransferase